MTTQSIFRRLFWKEYRLQRALWIAMTVLTAALQLLFFWFFSPRNRPLFIFWTAAGLPAMYLLGCGATLFAGEHESGVYEFQRSLPVGAKIVFCAKTSFAAVSAIAMYGLMALLAFALTGWTLRPPQEFNPLGLLVVSIFVGMELFFLTVLFSMTTRRVLLSAVLGVTTASIGFNATSLLISASASGVTSEHQLDMASAAAMFAALLALVDFWLATRWLRERQEKTLHPIREMLSRVGRAKRAPPETGNISNGGARCARPTLLSRPDRIAMLSRLFWQHWRQSWRLIVVLCAAFVVLAPFIAGVVSILFRGNSVTGQLFPDYVALTLALVFVPLLGLCAFLPDQSGRNFRFLTDRGVPPKAIWLSRQLVMLLPIILLLPLLLDFAYCLTPGEWSPLTQQYDRQYATTLLYVFGYVVLRVALGQMMPMFWRSGILAGVFSVLFMPILAGWWGLMLFWQVNCFWSVLPIPAAMFLATRLRTRNWLLERNTIRAWLLPLLTLAIPLLAIAVAVPLHRIHEIPFVQLHPDQMGKDFERPATAEEQATMRLYEQISQHYMKTNWLDAKHETIALGLKASRGKIFNPRGAMPGPNWIFAIAGYMTENATKLETEGRLDEALENYLAAIRISKQYRDWCEIWMWSPNYSADALERDVYARLAVWASRPKQTKQRILAARDQLEQLTSHISLAHDIRQQYFVLRHIIEGDLTVISAFDHGKFPLLPMPVQIWMRLPWERERALRLLAFETCAGRQGVRGPWPTSELLHVLSALAGLRTISQEWNVPETQWRETRTMRDDFEAMQTARAAVRLILMLEAWKLQHGSLPKTLDELVGPYLKEIPLDPYSHEPFRYFRNGIESPLRWGQPWMPAWPRSQYYQTLAANRPFIWSTGAEINVYSYTTDNDLLDKYHIWTRYPYEESSYRASRRPKSEHDIWESGWPFPIP
jgi:hypothetical protein